MKNSSQKIETINDFKKQQLNPNYEYREIYLNLEQKVYRSLSKVNRQSKIETWEIDLQIALMILSESPSSYTKSEFDLIKKVISNSDIIIEWFNSLSESEHRIKVSDYIIQIYNWAEKLYQWRYEKAINQPGSS